MGAPDSAPCGCGCRCDAGREARNLYGQQYLRSNILRRLLACGCRHDGINAGYATWVALKKSGGLASTAIAHPARVKFDQKS